MDFAALTMTKGASLCAHALALRNSRTSIYFTKVDSRDVDKQSEAAQGIADVL